MHLKAFENIEKISISWSQKFLFYQVLKIA